MIRSTLAWLLLAVSIVPTRAADLVDFDTEIIPILTRQGCNAGSCHGAAIGRGGFQLSLLGANAAHDHASIVHDQQARRVNLQAAERSLLLLKPSEQLGHEGGLRLDESAPPYAVMRAWIEQGAKRRELRTLTRLDVSPAETLLAGHDKVVSITVRAIFDDGSETDVTASTVFTADDSDAVQLGAAAGQITVARGGVHFVIARYLDRVVPIRLTVPLNSELLPQDRHVQNQIDVLINRQLDELRLPSSPRLDNGPLLRRLTLDLIGRLPTLDEYREFERDPSIENVVQRLLDSPAFADYWALKWANVLRIDSAKLQPEGARAFQRWLSEQLAEDAPITSMTREMLTSLGDGYANGPVNFLRTGASPGDLAEHASQVFMGAQLHCANCHNHPLDHWTQDDYHGLAAVFATLNRGRVVTVFERGEVTHPVTGQAAVARIPGQRYIAPESDGRHQFADWLTDPSNPYLARVTVNRLWKQLMGRGLVEPVDDLRATNPATIPMLMDWLTQDFIDNGYRMKSTIRTICLSAAYQRRAEPVPGNETDEVFYSKGLRRPLEAEVIADAIADATGVSIDYGVDDLIRAVTLTDNRTTSNVLDVLGRCDRSQSCGGGDGTSGSLARTLHLINGPLVNERVGDPHGRLTKLLAREPDNAAVLDELYQITMGHRAGKAAFWQQRFKEAELDNPSSRKEFFEDVFWSLLTSDTFQTNH
jgi:hypothetical protein